MKSKKARPFRMFWKRSIEKEIFSPNFATNLSVNILPIFFLLYGLCLQSNEFYQRIEGSLLLALRSFSVNVEGLSLLSWLTADGRCHSFRHWLAEQSYTRISVTVMVDRAWMSRENNSQTHNQLGTPGGAKSFLQRGPNFLNYVQQFWTIFNTLFQGERKKI